jgi:hypothetical protein
VFHTVRKSKIITVTCFQATQVQPSSVYSGAAPPFISYPTLTGPCITAAPQGHVMHHSNGAPLTLPGGGVQFVVQPAAATAAAIPVQPPPPPPMCITSLVLTPVSGLQGKVSNYSLAHRKCMIISLLFYFLS